MVGRRCGFKVTCLQQAVRRLWRDCQCFETTPELLKTEWEKWWNIFTMAVNAKPSISAHELLRVPSEQPTHAALIKTSINKRPKELVSIVFLSSRPTGRKNLANTYPKMVLATATCNYIKDNCEQTFRKPRNRMQDRYNIFSQKQQQNETKTVLVRVDKIAARCEFEQQTESLILDAFIQNMNNKTYQVRLCTKPEEIPQEAKICNSL